LLKEGSERFGGVIIYNLGIGPFYATFFVELHTDYHFGLVGVIAPSFLALLVTSDNKFIYMYQFGQWPFLAAFHGLAHLLHKEPGSTLTDAVALAHLYAGNALAGSAHFKSDAKSLVKTELYPMEKRTGGRAFNMAAAVTEIAMVLSPVPALVPALGTLETVLPFQIGQIVLAGTVIGECF